ncbi:MAG: helix-turn-helix transcriptional regulator [Ruminococcaceae bacterium]|nr:helix-turn-helix transcriptional regulator [Oscillospiraceae bacterium]
MDKIEIGKRIKNRRLELGFTQTQVTDGYMTRNMLSLIESGSALPSLDTLFYLSKKLDISLYFLLSDEDTKNENTNDSSFKDNARELYANGKYKECIDLLDTISNTDCETEYLYAYSAFLYGKQLTENGSFNDAQKYLRLALEKSQMTVYDTSVIETSLPLYLAISTNVQSPLLELDVSDYENKRLSAFDYELYKYLTSDFDFEFSNRFFKLHIEAKALMKKYRFSEAIILLSEIEEAKSTSYNAFVFFGVYTDLENAYKQIGDFENAYRYSSKRLNLINAFHS